MKVSKSAACSRGANGCAQRTDGLHHELGQRLLDFRALDLQHRDFRTGSIAGSQLVEEAQVGDRQRHQFDFDAGKPVAKARIVEQRLAILQLLRGEGLEAFEFALRRADARSIHALVAEQILGDRPAFALVVHAIFDGNPDVVEKHFVDFLATVEQFQGAHGDAR